MGVQMSPLFKPPIGEHLTIFRRDPGELLGTFSEHTILLDDEHWPSVEHYYQAMQFDETYLQERIRQAPTPREAVKIGEPGFPKKLLKKLWQKQRADWVRLKSVYMTRALYTKCKAYDEVAQRLLETGDVHLLETSQYDYYWGCGRDQRGKNMYGQVLMNIRERLRSENAEGPD